MMSEPSRRTSANAEEDLWQSAAILRSFYNSSDFLMGVVEVPADDSDIFHIYDNPATERYFECALGSTAGNSAKTLRTPHGIVEIWVRHYRESETLGTPVVFEYFHETPGTKSWLRASVSKIGEAKDGRTRFSYIAKDITDSKRAEEEREQSDLRYSKLFNTSPQPMWIFDVETLRLLKVNAAAVQYYGYTADEFLSLTIADIHPAEDAPKLRSFVTLQPSDKPSADGIWRHLRKDGTIIEVEIVSHRIDYDGRPARWVMAIDVSERMLAERRLKESEERLAAALEAGGLGVFTSVIGAAEVNWDKRLRDFWGFEKGETVTTSLLMRGIHPEDRRHVATALKAAKANPGPNSFSATYRVRNRRDHVERWIRAEGGVICEKDKPKRFVGTARDITDQKNTEQELHEQQHLYKSVTDNASLALFIMDERQQCVFMNPAAELLTGFTIDELRGRPLHDYIHHTRPDGSPYPLSECPIDQALPKNDRETGEEIFVHKDGHFYDVRFTASPIRGRTRDPIGTVIEVEDITLRKQTDRQLFLLMREVNHRSKNMLAVVQAIASQTASASTPEEFAKSFNDRLQSLAANHDLLVNNNWQGVDLSALVCSQLSHLGGALLDRIEVDGPPVHLSPTAAQAIGLALHELGTNAAKYGAISGEGTVHIGWQIEEDGKFRMRWKETGGPTVTAPKKRGFGSRLIAEMTKISLQGDVTLRFEPEGLEWELVASLEKVQGSRS